MFATIHKNLHRKEIATSISKKTFHRWLNGGSPHLKNLSACNSILQIDLSVAYAGKFSAVALQLFQTNETEKVSMILSRSYLTDSDKTLLGDHHKKRIWREIALIDDGLMNEY